MRWRSLLAAVLCLPVLAPRLEAAPIDLPIRTWVKRYLPAVGQGPCPTGCKHMRLARNTANGRIYFCGGDYDEADAFLQGGRNEVWSYDLAADNWRLEFPYCAPVGQVQAMHPDEVGWAYDSARNIFWMIPGYQGEAGPGTADGGLCPNYSTQMIHGQVMTFSPITQTWTWPQDVPEPNVPTLGDDGFAQYDPVSDTIIQFTYDGWAGVAIYDIKAKAWTQIRYQGLDVVLGKEYTAMDLENRVIYVIDGNNNKLYRYDMDARTLALYADAPPGSGAYQTHPVWDSVNRVMLWFDYGGLLKDPSTAEFHVFHPDTRTWEDLPHILPEDGGLVYGSQAFFDPVQNALIVMGGNIDPARPYFYLYRYGDGSGLPPPDATPPTAPADLRPH